MNQQEFEYAITELLNARINRDILFTTDKPTVVASHVAWVKAHSNGEWDKEVAEQRFFELQAQLNSDQDK